MRKARPAFQLMALAAVGAVVAACGSSNSNNGRSGIKPNGAWGKVPAAASFSHAGTVTVAQPPGATPTWIFPVTPGANSSVYTAYSFQAQFWRPLSWFPNGSQQKED